MKVLIATVTAGGGHVAAAAALAEAWKNEYRGDTVETVDLLKLFSKIHANAYTQGYVKFVEKFPELWGAVFTRTDDRRISEKVRQWRKLFPAQSRTRFVKQLKAFEPDVLLCTHYLPLDALRASNGTSPERRPLVASIVTDFEAHALWMADVVDLYCVAAEHTRARLLVRGADPERVVVTGIPISARFSQPLDLRAIRRRMGLRDDLPVLLVLGGGFGLGPVGEIVARIDQVRSECQVVVVTGRNTDLRVELAAQDRQHPTHILGYAPNMHELMAVANVVVTKPGGLTTAEALALGKPLLVVNPIPGQEAANSDFLLENGAACKINRVEDLPFRLHELLETEKLEKLSMAAGVLGRPYAAVAVCREARERAASR